MRRAFIVLALLFMTACPGGRPEDVAQNAPAQTSTSAQNAQAVPENSTAMSPVVPPSTHATTAAADVVNVQLTEYSIRMPETLTAGLHRLRIANAGKEMHGFAIDGPGVSLRMANDLSRGDTTEMSITLQKGTYRVWCPVDKHQARGMTRTVTVK